MKKVLTSGIVFSMLIGVGSAFAGDETALTTKNYVDSGLKAVYTVAKDAQDRVGTVEGTVASHTSSINTLTNTVTEHGTAINSHASDIEALETTVGDSTSGLVKDVADLKSAAQSGDTTAYTGGQGVTIDSHTVSITGLTDTMETANQAKRYIYQNGVLTELEVANTWNPNILNN